MKVVFVNKVYFLFAFSEIKIHILMRLSEESNTC